MNQPTYETTTRSIPTRRQVKIRSVHPGSAVKYGTLFSLIYALLTGVPLALVTIGVARLIISLLSPIINLFHGSVAGATASATSTTLLLLLVYVLAITLLGCIFTLLAALAYNLLARLTGGLTLDLEDVRQAAQMAVPQEVRQAAGTAAPEAEKIPEAKEIAPSEEGAKAEGKPTLNMEGSA